MTINKESTPPPVIGKIGPYTVFMTPPSTPSPKSAENVPESPKKIVPPPPIQVPPQQFQKSVVSDSISDGSVLGFLKNAAVKVQIGHSRVDDHLAKWFGLNQSKYQWALDDYYESEGVKGDNKLKEVSEKMQSV